MTKARTDAQDRKESDSYMLVNGAWPLWIVRTMRAAVWSTSPAKAMREPVLAGPHFLGKKEGQVEKSGEYIEDKGQGEDESIRSFRSP